jgi:DNA repair exonuclease SbcCD ATPase subunit
MENKELKTLEEKIKRILETLDDLEKEVLEYQQKNIDIASAFANLSNISEKISEASSELSNSAQLFSSSDFSSAMREIDKRIEHIKKAEITFVDQAQAINTIVANVLTEYKKLNNEIKAVNSNICKLIDICSIVSDTKQYLDALGVRIERIDMNTQRWFRKVKG